MSLAADGGTAAAMAAARIAGSAHAGRLRLSFHISTSEARADHAIDTLRPHIFPSTQRPGDPIPAISAQLSPSDPELICYPCDLCR